MAYARIENSTVRIYLSLPQQWTFTRNCAEVHDLERDVYYKPYEEGSTTGNFADMPAWIHDVEGFLPFEDNPPAYEPALYTLEQDGYEITEKLIRQKYKITPIPDGLIAVRQAEAEEAAWGSIRSTRNALLAASDWTQLVDSTCAEEWREYRQLLRDITDIFPTPTAVIWPEKPII